MGITHQQFLDATERERVRQVDSSRSDFQNIIAEGTAMSELLVDPKWNTLLEKMEAIKQRYDKEIQGCDQELNGNMLLSLDKVQEIRIRRIAADHFIKGLTVITDIVKTLVEKGDKASKVLDFVDQR